MKKINIPPFTESETLSMLILHTATKLHKGCFLVVWVPTHQYGDRIMRELYYKIKSFRMAIQVNHSNHRITLLDLGVTIWATQDNSALGKDYKMRGLNYAEIDLIDYPPKETKFIDGADLIPKKNVMKKRTKKTYSGK